MRADSAITRLLVFARASLYREAWCALLSNQPYIQVGGAIRDLDGLTSLLIADQPTTILFDVPEIEPDLVYQLRARAPDCGVLCLVEDYELMKIVALLQAGATGCVSRDESVGDLTRAIHATARAEIVLPPAIATRALTSLANTTRALAALSHHQPIDRALIEALSERETEIVRLLGQGLTNKDIAQTLIVSVRTVEAHLRNLYDKLGVRSRTEAALWAVRQGNGQDE